MIEIICFIREPYKRNHYFWCLNLWLCTWTNGPTSYQPAWQDRSIELFAPLNSMLQIISETSRVRWFQSQQSSDLFSLTSSFCRIKVSGSVALSLKKCCSSVEYLPGHLCQTLQPSEQSPSPPTTQCSASCQDTPEHFPCVPGSWSSWWSELPDPGTEQQRTRIPGLVEEETRRCWTVQNVPGKKH